MENYLIALGVIVLLAIFRWVVGPVQGFYSVRRFESGKPVPRAMYMQRALDLNEELQQRLGRSTTEQVRFAAEELDRSLYKMLGPSEARSLRQNVDPSFFNQLTTALLNLGAERLGELSTQFASDRDENRKHGFLGEAIAQEIVSTYLFILIGSVNFRLAHDTATTEFFDEQLEEVAKQWERVRFH